MPGFLLTAKNIDITKSNFCLKGVLECLIHMFYGNWKIHVVEHRRANPDVHPQEKLYPLTTSSSFSFLFF